VLQIFHGLAWGVPAAADVAEDLGGGLAAVVALGQHTVERFRGNLCDGIPDGNLDRADRDRALAVTAGFFPLHHDGENFARTEILLCLVKERSRIGTEDTGDEARAHRRTAGIAAGRVEGETDDWLAVAHDIGDDRDDRGRHLGKIEARIPDVRLERDRAFADVYDTHLGFIPANSCYSAVRKVPFRTPSFAREPRGGWDVGSSAGRAPRRRCNPRRYRRRRLWPPAIVSMSPRKCGRLPRRASSRRGRPSMALF